jgi:hypothetical protein
MHRYLAAVIAKASRARAQVIGGDSAGGASMLSRAHGVEVQLEIRDKMPHVWHAMHGLA